MSASASTGSRAPAAAGGGGSATRSYGRGAGVLAAGIGVTGLVTYSYFSLASHALSAHDYGEISLLWSAIFIVVSVLYRPVEQLLSRTISDRHARGLGGTSHLRVAATIQLALAALFAVAALILRPTLEDDLLGGSATLYWVLFSAVLAYAASYFARGFLAGHRRFGLYGGLVLMEATSRFAFALAVTVGLASGQGVVAAGMAAAPIVSLAVVPWALARRLRRPDPPPAPHDSRTAETLDSAAEPTETGGAGAEPELTLSHGASFAVAVLVIMVCEQTFLNAGPLLVKAVDGDGGAAIAGFVFNVLLIARAPLQLFQAVQTSILPHLTRLAASGEADPFRRSVQVTVRAIAAFAALVALGFLVLGPFAMKLLFGGDTSYARGGLVVVSIGMGLYLSAATLNQAALAAGRARRAAISWACSAAAFVGFLLTPGWDDRVLQVEVGYCAAAGLLCALLYALYRGGTPARAQA
ncbi:MAG: oligosaccharide flippase family protein [Thermoleophilaceae bacterium]|nr:oligosaccharide flippase family protein [Thermoleophilaceae bacterium]